jgi:hypothetical protein
MINTSSGSVRRLEQAAKAIGAVQTNIHSEFVFTFEKDGRKVICSTPGDKELHLTAFSVRTDLGTAERSTLLEFSNSLNGTPGAKVFSYLSPESELYYSEVIPLYSSPAMVQFQAWLLAFLLECQINDAASLSFSAWASDA